VSLMLELISCRRIDINGKHGGKLRAAARSDEYHVTSAMRALTCVSDLSLHALSYSSPQVLRNMAPLIRNMICSSHIRYANLFVVQNFQNFQTVEIGELCHHKRGNAMSKVTTMSVSEAPPPGHWRGTLECVVEVVMYPPRSTMDGSEGDENSDPREARLSTWMC
jgi:hypothetical protein